MKEFFGHKTRYLQLSALTIYFTIFMTSLNADRFGYYVIPIILYGAAFDMLSKYYFSKKWEFPLSGLITALACIMLMRTKLVIWPYFLAITLGQSFKFLFKNQSGHFFNPANIGLFITITFFSGLSNIQAGQWIVGIELYTIMTLIGLIVAFFNKRWILSLSYLLTLVLARYLFAYINNLNSIFFLASVVNTASLIFTFHMITDPLTSPKSYSGQILFGVTVGLLDFQLRRWQIPFAPIFALCLVCAILNPLRSSINFLKSR